jgi:hypothetical protein
VLPQASLKPDRLSLADCASEALIQIKPVIATGLQSSRTSIVAGMTGPGQPLSSLI